MVGPVVGRSGSGLAGPWRGSAGGELADSFKTSDFLLLFGNADSQQFSYGATQTIDPRKESTCGNIHPS